MATDRLFDLHFYLQEFDAALHWLDQNALSLSIATVAQAVLVGFAFLIARLATPRLKALLARLSKRRHFEVHLVRLAAAMEPLALPVLWLSLQWLVVLVATRAGWPVPLVNLVVSLLTAWAVIRFTVSVVRDPLWSRFIAFVAWTIAALNILHLLGPTGVLLDSLAVTLGGLRISVLTVVKAMLALAVLLWVATLLSRLVERRITTVATLTPSLQVLFVKLFKFALIAIAVVAALRTVGIDLTAFAIFTGAVGVGVGFGLQKAVSNFVSGITILLDKSIKPGDVISVGETYGWVQSLGTRYVSVVTRDGMEFLIPNEDLITRQVVNWSYSSDQVRLKVPVGVSYNTDIPRAVALCREAAEETARVLPEPKPTCLLKGFGDSSVDLELRFWIRDPRNGISNVKSEVLLLIWNKFHANGIGIPFPQRDLHLKSPAEVRVVMDNAEGG